MFQLYDKATKTTNPVGFSLRYWQGYQGNIGSHSGVYLFRPDNDEYDSYPYSNLFTILGSDAGTITPQFLINFKDGGSSIEGDAVVSVKLCDLAVIQFDVLLYGIPYDSNIGHEVTVNFHAPNIANNGIFYTDSNGLEMQRRQLNYRPTWNLTTSNSLNITANYYPVNSAIAIVDETTKMSLVVMNDRSQGGSVIKDGRIELMQNRRLNVDDHRGMGEALNETD